MLTQAINRIDHVAILVYPENLDAYVQKLSDVLGVSFDEPVHNQHVGLTAVLSWDSGLEVYAPTRPEGKFWEKLQTYGEGTATIIFGVRDIDAGLKRAKDHGLDCVFEVRLNGDEPWLTRFKHFREARLEDIMPETALSLTLSQIEPR